MTHPDPAPHGRDDAGKPLAPYGLKTDGTPRISNRGAKPGARSTTRTGPAASVKSLTDVVRKGMLTELADMFLVSPLASLSQVPALTEKLGPKHTDALAGDALIVSHFAPALADVAILYSKTKPGALAWLDKTQENAPLLMLASVGVQMVKALVDNHMNPNPNMAEAGRSLAALKMAKIADAVQAEAAQYAAAGTE
jgi:hypothetical protein